MKQYAIIDTIRLYGGEFMQSGSFFKTAAFGGFEKKDVLNYIDEIHKKMLKLESEAEEKASQFEELIEKIASTEKDRDEKVADLTDQLNQGNNQISNLENKLEKKEILATELNKRLAEKEEHINGLNAELNEVNNKNRQYEAQIRQHEETTREVGNVMLDARRTADSIISQANATAAKAYDEINEYKAQVQEALNVLKGEIAQVSEHITQLANVGDEKIGLTMKAIDRAIGEAAIKEEYIPKENKTAENEYNPTKNVQPAPTYHEEAAPVMAHTSTSAGVDQIAELEAEALRSASAPSYNPPPKKEMTLWEKLQQEALQKQAEQEMNMQNMQEDVTDDEEDDSEEIDEFDPFASSSKKTSKKGGGDSSMPELDINTFFKGS